MNINSRRRSVRLKTLAIAFAGIMLLSGVSILLTSGASATPVKTGNVDSEKPLPSTDILGTMDFPAGTFLLPMDDRQPDVVQSFGFIHAILRNWSYIYRIIEYPNVTVKTNASPAGDIYYGGPVLIMASSAGIIDIVHPAFPSVVIETVTEGFTSDRVYVVREATKILMFKYGSVSRGFTDVLLSEMKIPYDIYDGDVPMAKERFKNDPSIINSYSLFIDDCQGIYLKNGAPNDISTETAFRNYVAAGNEIIFTCWAINDIVPTFPEYVSGINTGSKTSRDSNIAELPEFPGQYYGAPQVTFVNIWSQITPLLPNVSVVAKGTSYADALYFPFGKGIAEFFSFHPGEQTGAARRAAVTLYGNKFIHFGATDIALSAKSESSPDKIATKGSSSPLYEKCNVNLMTNPIGFDVIPTDHVTVNYKLNPYIDIVPNTFTDPSGNPLPPDDLKTNPDNTKSMQWHVGFLKSTETWKVSFKVTSTRAGTGVVINDDVESNVTYLDQWGFSSENPFLDLKVDVVDGYMPPITESYLPLALMAVFTVTVAVIWRRRAKQ